MQDIRDKAYNALIKILRNTPGISARKFYDGSKGKPELSNIEQNAFYVLLLAKCCDLKFDVLERKKIARDLQSRKIEISFMSKRVGAKLLTVWSEEDINAVL